jgi:hypothetical protein
LCSSNPPYHVSLFLSLVSSNKAMTGSHQSTAERGQHLVTTGGGFEAAGDSHLYSALFMWDAASASETETLPGAIAGQDWATSNPYTYRVC